VSGGKLSAVRIAEGRVVYVAGVACYAGQTVHLSASDAKFAIDAGDATPAK